jgi:hypothetical protein
MSIHPITRHTQTERAGDANQFRELTVFQQERRIARVAAPASAANLKLHTVYE